MADSPLLQLVDTDGPEPSPLATALLTVKREIDAQAAYQETVAETLFASSSSPKRKETLKFERTLLATSTLGILAILWKESAFVSDKDLALAKLERSFSLSEPLTCHSLATSLAETPRDVAKTLKRVEGVVAAAEAFGLVERSSMKGRNERWKELRGTQKLGDLMQTISTSLESTRGTLTIHQSGGSCDAAE